MAGHSKWANIKHRKGANDKRRGKLFTKLIREIEVSARSGGGGDPLANPRLRDAIAEAKSNNLPKDTISRAIKRGTGELEGVNYENVIYEGYGPAGVAFLIEVLTDNRNRSVADVRAALNKNGGSLGEAGSVAWMFEKKGIIFLEKGTESEDQMMNAVLEAGGEDLKKEEEGWEIVTDPSEFTSVHEAIENAGFKIKTADRIAIPKTTIDVSGETAEKVLKLVDVLEDMDDVQKVYTNVEIDDEELERLLG